MFRYKTNTSPPRAGTRRHFNDFKATPSVACRANSALPAGSAFVPKVRPLLRGFRPGHAANFVMWQGRAGPTLRPSVHGPLRRGRASVHSDPIYNIITNKGACESEPLVNYHIKLLPKMIGKGAMLGQNIKGLRRHVGRSTLHTYSPRLEPSLFWIVDL
jgi:hypothetical protein